MGAVDGRWGGSYRLRNLPGLADEGVSGFGESDLSVVIYLSKGQGKQARYLDRSNCVYLHRKGHIGRRSVLYIVLSQRQPKFASPVNDSHLWMGSDLRVVKLLVHQGRLEDEGSLLSNLLNRSVIVRNALRHTVFAMLYKKGTIQNT